MAHLSIRVLGPFQIGLAGEPVTGFASDKVRALLAYLALSPDRPHRRETLAGLLWPEFPERSARSSLRNALANLRRVIGDGRASPPFLHCTRQTIQFNGQSDYWLDAHAFEALLAPLPAASEQLEQAVSLVRGPFLEGFTLADAAPFEEWLLLRREHLGRQVVEVLDCLVAICERCGAYEKAIAHARRRVDLEPWQEDGQRQLMRRLARMGHRSEALTHYDRLCRSLRAELGAEPSAETEELSKAILAGELAPEPVLRPGPPVPVWNLPALPTPFFGRADELAALQAMLGEPSTRLVTLTGLGGSGKTRLALEVGARIADRERRALAEQSALTFAHGIVFVPLAALDSVEGLVPALADALQLRLEEGQEQLLEFLCRKQLLLILDNLEQLLAGVRFLAKVLSAAPGVKILATSRERLQMHGEHVLPLAGLPFPEQDPKCELPEGGDLDACLADYPALQLLVEGVRRVRPGYAKFPRDADPVGHLPPGGRPALGTRTGRILGRRLLLERHPGRSAAQPGLLAGGLARPARATTQHARRVRRLLAAAQPGGAAFQAAAGIAAEAGSSAKAIVDKVTRLRVVVRALAWLSNFQRVLGQWDAARQTQQQCQTILKDPALVDSDTRLERAILAYCVGLTLHSVDFEGARQQFEESFGLFRDLDLRWGMARALVAWGNTCAILGSHKDAQRRLEEGLAIWRVLGNQSGVSTSLGFLAYLTRMEGRFEEAATLAREAYVISLEQGSQGRGGMSRLFYGTALEYLGQFAEAQAVIQEGLALASDLGNRISYTLVHTALVRIDLHWGRYQEARDLGEMGLVLAGAHGPRFNVGLNLLLLGCLDLVAGTFASALQHIQDSIAVYRDYGQTDDLSWGFAVLALAAHSLGKIGEATQHLLHALQIAVDMGAVPPLLWALPAAALLLVDGGEYERAVELYALASRYPFVAKSRWFADVSGNQLAAVAATLPAERVAVLEERGRTRDLEATVAALLTELSSSPCPGASQ